MRRAALALALLTAAGCAAPMTRDADTAGASPQAYSSPAPSYQPPPAPAQKYMWENLPDILWESALTGNSPEMTGTMYGCTDTDRADQCQVKINAFNLREAGRSP